MALRMFPRLVRSTATATSSSHSRSTASARRVMSRASACRPSCHRRSPRLRSPLRNNVVSPRSCADPQRRGQGSIGRVESLEQRRQVALAQVDLGQPRGTPFARQVRDQRVDDLLLTRAQTQRLAHPLLLEQQVRGEIALVRRAGGWPTRAPDRACASASANWLSAIARSAARRPKRIAAGQSSACPK